jgi:transketolase
MKNLRQEFSDLMLKTGNKDKRLVVIVGDISHGLLKPFAKKFSNRYYNIGICEPSMVNLAAGMSKLNLIPVVHTIAPFLIERSYEQIKLDFGYQKLGVNLVSVGSSFDYSKLGCSHHTYADVSLINHIKNTTIIIPGSVVEFNVLFKKIYRKKSINYFRLTEFSHGVRFKKSQIKFGKGITVKKGKDLTICVIGSQLKNALEANKTLEALGVSVEILYFHTFKPFDKDLVRKSVKKTKKLLTVENLSSADGLYSRCLDSCVNSFNFAVRQIAIRDFVLGYGTYEELCSRAKIGTIDIIKESKKLLKI